MRPADGGGDAPPASGNRIYRPRHGLQREVRRRNRTPSPRVSETASGNRVVDCPRTPAPWHHRGPPTGTPDCCRERGPRTDSALSARSPLDDSPPVVGRSRPPVARTESRHRTTPHSPTRARPYRHGGACQVKLGPFASGREPPRGRVTGCAVAPGFGSACWVALADQHRFGAVTIGKQGAQRFHLRHVVDDDVRVGRMEHHEVLVVVLGPIELAV